MIIFFRKCKSGYYHFSRWYIWLSSIILYRIDRPCHWFTYYLKAPIYGYEEENDRYHIVESRIEEELGPAPETYGLAAYDALWLATFVDLDAVPENDESTKLAMNTLSDTYFGVTGWTKLDENGDRVHWDYDIWAISENNGNYEWRLDAMYQVDPGEEGKLMYVE